jgi:uncharacterized protein YfeS
MRFHNVAYICLCLSACSQVENHTPKITVDTTRQKNNNVVTIQKKDNNVPLPSFDKAHSNAKLLLNEPFYFNASDEAAPFGNRDGADSYTAFYTWRQTHKKNSTNEFSSKHINNLGYPKFDISETDTSKIISYTQHYEFGNRFISGIDAVIIAVAFGQLYLEGIIDKDVKEQAKTAIRRQLAPCLLLMWGEPYKTERKKKFTKMLAILDK